MDDAWIRYLDNATYIHHTCMHDPSADTRKKDIKKGREFRRRKAEWAPDKKRAGDGFTSLFKNKQKDDRHGTHYHHHLFCLRPLSHYLLRPRFLLLA